METVCNPVRIASFRFCLNVKAFLSPFCALECWPVFPHLIFQFYVCVRVCMYIMNVIHVKRTYIHTYCVCVFMYVCIYISMCVTYVSVHVDCICDYVYKCMCDTILIVCIIICGFRAVP